MDRPRFRAAQVPDLGIRALFLAGVLEALQVSQRDGEIMLARIIDQQSVEAICARFDCERTTVWRSLHRTRAAMANSRPELPYEDRMEWARTVLFLFPNRHVDDEPEFTSTTATVWTRLHPRLVHADTLAKAISGEGSPR